MRSSAALAIGFVVLTGLAPISAWGKTEDSREVQGRTLFAKGKYEEALDVFATLFAEKADPIYLRNIGRCHQKLSHPSEAIDAFREYARRSRLTDAERVEIDGFIREMQELKATMKATPEPPPRQDGTREGTGAPSSSATTVATAAAPPAVLVAPVPGPTSDRGAAPEPRPITRRWWFWTAVGALVVGAAVTAVVLSTQGGASRPDCPAGFGCTP